MPSIYLLDVTIYCVFFFTFLVFLSQTGQVSKRFQTISTWEMRATSTYTEI